MLWSAFNRLSQPSFVHPLASYTTAYFKLATMIYKSVNFTVTLRTYQPVHTFAPTHIIGATAFVYSAYTHCLLLAPVVSVFEVLVYMVKFSPRQPLSFRNFSSVPQFCSNIKNTNSPKLADCPRIWFTLNSEFVRMINNVYVHGHFSYHSECAFPARIIHHLITLRWGSADFEG